MRGLAAFILVFSVWASVVRAEAPGVLGIAVTMAEDEDFFAAMIAAKQAGADAATLSLFWDETMLDGAYAPRWIGRRRRTAFIQRPGSGWP